MGSNRQRAWRLAVAGATLAVIGFAVPTAIGAGQKESDPGATGSIDGGTTANIDITIKNTSTAGNITAQSFRVYLPSNFAAGNVVSVVKSPANAPGSITSIATTLAAATPYVEVMDASIARNKTYTIRISAKTPCSEGGKTYAWTTDVRQSNDFNGTNNQIPAVSPDPTPATTSVYGCSMAFSTQPANAASGAVITNTAFDPAGPKVAVTVITHSGVAAKWFAGTITVASQPASTVSGGSANVTFDAGTGVSPAATFSSLSIAENGTYTLKASTAEPGVTSPSGPSSSFVIGGYNCAVDGQACTSGLITGSNGNSAVVTVEDTTNEITGTLRAELTLDTLDCAGFDYEYGDTLVFDITSTSDLAGYSKTVVMNKPTEWGTDSADFWKYQTCFEADYPFKSMVYYASAQANYESLLNIISGGPMPTATETAPGSGHFRGLLPTCDLLEFDRRQRQPPRQDGSVGSDRLPVRRRPPLRRWRNQDDRVCPGRRPADEVIVHPIS